MSFTYSPTGRDVPFWQIVWKKLREIHWGLVLLLVVVACIGFAMLYSTGGDADSGSAAHALAQKRMLKQMLRFGVGLIVLLVIGLVDIRIWLSLAYPAYAVALILLLGVEFFGVTGMGAKRWVDLGLFRLQPSEVMKVAMVLALARYLHGLTIDQVSRLKSLMPAVAIILVPVALVVRQPDLGTALLLMIGGACVLFLAGLSWRIVGAAALMGLASAVAGWQFLQDYQKQRVLTFLDPDSDPLGSGYHILQSKIALGSGGVFGKGFGQGSQSQLNFLPEKHTDFIFTMLGEEFGLLGGLTLLMFYFLILLVGVNIALNSRNHFGRLMCMGVMVTFLLYVAINISMVMGLIPVVGVPLPLVSYGGTAMMTILFGFGLVMSVHIHRDIDVPRHSGAFW